MVLERVVEEPGTTLHQARAARAGRVALDELANRLREVFVSRGAFPQTGQAVVVGSDPQLLQTRRQELALLLRRELGGERLRQRVVGIRSRRQRFHRKAAVDQELNLQTAG